MATTNETKRKAEIANILSNAGVHAVMTLPTLEGYDFAISPFELFVLHGTQIEFRLLQNRCSIHFVKNQDGSRKLVLSRSPLVGGAFYETSYQAKVPGNIPANQNPAIRFGFAVDNRPFFNSWNFLWEQTLLTEFCVILRDWHIWKQIPARGKYQASSIVDFGTPRHIEIIGQLVGRSLFTNLDAFLIKPMDEPYFIEKLRFGNWGVGITPSLHMAIEILRKISNMKIGLQASWEIPDAFSQGQVEALHNIRADLKRYSRPNKLWENLVSHPAFFEDDRLKSTNLLNRFADKQVNDDECLHKLLATYIRTYRNAMAHNRNLTDLQEHYLYRVGFEGIQENLTGKAIEVCYNFLVQLYTKVFGLPEEDMLRWRKQANQNAEEEAMELLARLSS